MLASNEETSSGAFVYALFYFCLYSVLRYWNISIGKAVPCNFLCLNFLLALFLYTPCDYMGKKNSSRHFSNCVAECMHLIPYVSTCYIFSHQRTDISSWHILLVLVVKPTVLANWRNTLLLTWEILLWGYKEHNCWFLMLVCSFNDLTLHIIKK